MNKTLAIRVALGALLTLSGGRAWGQTPAAVASEDGIPITDQLTISKCGTCHTKDAKGNLTRISWERTTPEGWEEAIKRMSRLNGVTLSPSDSRAILKYLGYVPRARA